MLEISEFALRRMRKSLAVAALPGRDDLCFRVLMNKFLDVDEHGELRLS